MVNTEHLALLPVGTMDSMKMAPLPLPRSVLIVDNAEDSREMYAEYLRYRGHVVETANNARDAMTRASATSPDAIVLDLWLPGIDGFEAMRLLRANEKTAKTFIVVVTAHALTGTEDRVLKAGADVYLTKPCLPEDLAAVIASRRRPAASLPSRRSHLPASAASA
jgi:two-component system, cell cycle response regulator DivK